METVYLAGPLTGCDYEAAMTWRRQFSYLVPNDIRLLSPVFAEPKPEDGILKQIDGDKIMGGRPLLCRDKHNIERADIIVANLLGATHVSIGTVAEIAWAHWMHKPVITVMEPEGNCHEHFMIQEMSDYRVETLEEAAEAVLVTRGGL